MNDPRDLAALAGHMARAGIEVLEVRNAAGRFRLVADAAGNRAAPAPDAEEVPPPATAEAVPPREIPVTASGIGRLRLRHPGRAEPEAAEGDAVRQGQVHGFLAAGERLQPVLAPADGVLGAALAAEGSLLGFGDRIFTVLAG